MPENIAIETQWLTGAAGRAWAVRGLAEGESLGVRPLIVLCMETFGLNAYIQSICERLAQAGYDVIAPDFFDGRTYDYDDLATALTDLRALDDGEALRRIEDALTSWQARDGEVERLATLGFCMGGRLAFLAHAALGARSAACVAFYGGGIAPREDHLGRPNLLDKVPAMQGPLLLHYGAEDASIGPDEHARIVEALSAARRRYSLHVYPEAGHAFCCDARAAYHAGAAGEAWALTLDFLKHQL